MNNKEQSKASLIWGEKVGHLPLQKPVMVSHDATIDDVISTMRENRCGCVLVTDESKSLCGLFTERDLMKKYVGTGLPPETPVRDVMTKDPLSLPETATVSQAIYFIGEKNFRHLPITGKTNKVKGILSVRVLVYFIAEHLPGAVLNLPPDEKKIPRQVEGG